MLQQTGVKVILLKDDDALVEVTYRAEIYFKTDEAAITFAESITEDDEDIVEIPDFMEN